MKIYLAGKYSSKEEIREKAAELRALGIEVTSTWLEEPHAPNTAMSDVPEDDLAVYAQNDLTDIEMADWLVFFSEDPTTSVVRGGRHVEFGYALATDMGILVVGPHENIFHHLPEVIVISTWNEAKEFLVKESDALNEYVERAG